MSHSVAGNAVPHADGTTHGHSHDIAEGEHDDHDDADNVDTDDRAMPDSSDEPFGQASGHTHFPGAVLPDADSGLTTRALEKNPALALSSPSLVGRGTAPLIEPPSV